jgi:hypothetical protein
MGGLGLYLAKTADCDVTGVTLSREQHKTSNVRAAREGLARAVRFRFEDDREVEGCFDRVVSVGMFEHVGVKHYAALCGILSTGAQSPHRGWRGGDPSYDWPAASAGCDQPLHRQIDLSRWLHSGSHPR